MASGLAAPRVSSNVIETLLNLRVGLLSGGSPPGGCQDGRQQLPKWEVTLATPEGREPFFPDALAWARGLRWFCRVSFLSSTSRWWFHSWSLGEDGREWSSHTWSHRGPGAAPVQVSPKRASRHVPSQASGLRRTHYWGGLCTCHGVNLWGCRGFAGFGLRLPCALNTGLVL